MGSSRVRSPLTRPNFVFDHGYAVTSHSFQGLTAGRMLTNIDTEASINTRLAYVAVSRASDDVRI
jgi:ATP-dependent exoDNAse (exonuclease V) alpha subunit